MGAGTQPLPDIWPTPAFRAGCWTSSRGTDRRRTGGRPDPRRPQGAQPHRPSRLRPHGQGQPANLFTKSAARLVSVGNLEDDFDAAVGERLDHRGDRRAPRPQAGVDGAHRAVAPPTPSSAATPPASRSTSSPRGARPSSSSASWAPTSSTRRAICTCWRSSPRPTPTRPLSAHEGVCRERAGQGRRGLQGHAQLCRQPHDQLYPERPHGVRHRERLHGRSGGYAHRSAAGPPQDRHLPPQRHRRHRRDGAGGRQPL
jgi:hypothetical protein